MAITFYDGFENYVSRQQMLQGRWLTVDNLVRVVGDAATGSRCVELSATSDLRAGFGPGAANAGVAFHVKLAGIPKFSNHRQLLHRFRDNSGRDVFGLKVSNTGRLLLLGGGWDSGVLGTSKSPIPALAWTHVEIVVVGTEAKVYVNGRLEITASQPKLWDDLSQVCFGYDTVGVSGGTTIWLDDVVAQEIDVAQLGICGVHYVWPNADKLPQDWELTSGTQAWALINERDPDDDSRYIFASASGMKSAFGVTQLPSNVDTVLAVAPIARMRKSDMGDTSVGLGVKSGAVEAVGDDLPLHPNYVYQASIFEVDPDTGERWSPLNMPDIFVRRNT